jgi:hypothetical protein
MTEHLKKNISADSLLDDYLKKITDKCNANAPVVKKQMKVSSDNTSIPTIQTYNELVYNNYNITQLKSFAKHYKLKLSGNKPQLLSRIYSYLYFSSYIIKIQKVARGKMVRTYMKLHGPACFNRKSCTNVADFITMEPVEEIQFHQFVSYKDVDEFIYGFDITSLHNLFLKSAGEMRNPYNRNIIPDAFIKSIRSIIRISKIIGIDINLSFEDVSKVVSNEKAIELRALTLFQNIDALGNYSNAQWFLSLNRYQICRFVRELIDIWNYRAQLTQHIKRNICPPFGNPFNNLNIEYITTEPDLWNIKNVLLTVMEKLVNTGIDRDNKALGAYYVLGALTLVNNDAATSLPWLFQSFH